LKQEEIIRKFYSGEINLLICTYEIEEYIQSPSSVNLIIRFNCSSSSASSNDTNANTTSSSSSSMLGSVNSSSTQTTDHLPFDYFSYISTKIRAKSKSSACYFFIEKSCFEQFFRQFTNFKQIENLLIKNYSKLIELNRPILESSTVTELFSQTNVINASGRLKSLNINNSIYFLNKYCVRLPSDSLTQLTPRFQCLERKSLDSNKNEYKCILHLPINSGVQDSIESDWFVDNRNAAKLDAAYKACFILFLHNEVNSMLDPITKEIFYKQQHRPDADDEREWSHFNQHFNNSKGSSSFYDDLYGNSTSTANYMAHRPGGNKRKQTYSRKVSAYLKNMQLVTTTQPCYLYLIKSELTTPIVNPKGLEKNEEGKANYELWSFGLLASKPLLEIVDFPIFTPNGEETISLELVKSAFYLSPNQLKSIKLFHRFLFSNVLRMEGRGAIASSYLSNLTTGSAKAVIDQLGLFVCILACKAATTGGTKPYDFDWELMKKCEGCTDRSFIKYPSYSRKAYDPNQENEEDASQDEKQVSVEGKIQNIHF
jgi:hypothetical protein